MFLSLFNVSFELVFLSEVFFLFSLVELFDLSLADLFSELLEVFSDLFSSVLFLFSSFFWSVSFNLSLKSSCEFLSLFSEEVSSVTVTS